MLSVAQTKSGKVIAVQKVNDTTVEGYDLLKNDYVTVLAEDVTKTLKPNELAFFVSNKARRKGIAYLFKKIQQILVGTTNEVLNKETRLYQERMYICKRCPLFKPTKERGPVCNSGLMLNMNTGKTRLFIERIDDSLDDVNYVRGCGCRLEAKTRAPDSECPAKKW